MKGKFITFEGCEGVGKSRQIKEICNLLDAEKINYRLVREPGGTSISEKIREIILDGNNRAMCDRCEALLYAASREQLVAEVIAPALGRGELVLCDRYIDSSLAYQGYARGLGFDYVEKINRAAAEECMPDCTVFLKLDPEKAFMRKGGADKNDRLELSGMEFHRRVYEGYLLVAKKYPERFIVIDAGGTRAETHEKIVSALKERGIIT